MEKGLERGRGMWYRERMEKDSIFAEEQPDAKAGLEGAERVGRCVPDGISAEWKRDKERLHAVLRLAAEEGDIEWIRLLIDEYQSQQYQKLRQGGRTRDQAYRVQVLVDWYVEGLRDAFGIRVVD